jgi:hypothetical protein
VCICAICLQNCFQNAGEQFEGKLGAFKMLASVSKKKTTLSKRWRAFQRKDLCFQNVSECFKGKIYAFKMLASVSKQKNALSKP